MRVKEFIQKSYLKPWDFIIILLLIVASLLPFAFFSTHKTDSKEAILKVNGEVIKTFILKKNGPTYTYKYIDEDGEYNLIEVQGDKIHIIQTNCGDQICVQRGFISQPGEPPIVCVPHNLLITVKATTDGGDDGSLIY